MKRFIRTTHAAPPPKSARYSHAVEVDGVLHVTGQLPIDPAAPDAALPGSIEAQTELVFRNLAIIVEAAGYRLSDAVFVRIYLSDFDRDYAGLNAVYRRFFNDDETLPGRTTIGVARLGRQALVEIEMTLARSSD
jgi:2-iminobutanoate/2-iminopropanoate deaminase